MKKAAIFLLLSLIFIIAQTGFAAELYDTVSTQSDAAVVIDGENTDWNWLNRDPAKIGTINIWSNQGRPRNDSDLSATFMCYKDTRNIYVTINVFDDRLVFGEAPFGKLYQDDAVEIIIGMSQDNPLKIWVSMDSQGKTKIEGREPKSPQTYPFLQKTLGIKSVLATNNKGYTVEIAIPVRVIESLGWNQTEALGMNIRVYDDDDSDQCESVLEWSGNPVNPYKVSLNQVNFHEIISQVSSESGNQGEVTGNKQEIEIILGEPVQQNNPENYENRLGLALVLEEEKKYSECISKLNDLISECKDIQLIQKCKLALGRNYFFLNDFGSARKICEELIDSDADSKIILDARMILVSIEQKKEQ
ncbi:MAG: hypothetical protein JXB48_14395 [Candidatus Latescibacteria bacterium]|nr:hypothetical protein [Candidatus Latescibacterota bacterium]